MKTENVRNQNRGRGGFHLQQPSELEDERMIRVSRKNNLIIQVNNDRFNQEAPTQSLPARSTGQQRRQNFGNRTQIPPPQPQAQATAPIKPALKSSGNGPRQGEGPRYVLMY